MIDIIRLDHLVLTVADIKASCDFYCGVLGMRKVRFGAGRTALAFGAQKINLHQSGAEIEPKASLPTPGTADICLIVETPMNVVVDHLSDWGLPIILGPVARTGAQGPIESVYIRDPDGNLIELSSYTA